MGNQFQAGASQLDITPHLGIRMPGGFRPGYAEDVHDPLYAKAVVMDDGNNTLVIVALDVIALSLADVRAIRADVAQRTGIPHHHILIGCTHTHTGPATQAIHQVEREDDYVRWLVRRVADAVTLAQRRLQPARIAIGRGELHGVSFCRRFRMRDGTVRMNPGRDNPDIIEPTSPIDPTVGVIYIENEKGVPQTLLAQFGMHYVGTDNSRAISADYFGHFARIVRNQLGPQCISLLLNGSIGQINNVNPFDSHTDRGHQRARRVARALAGEVFKVIGRARLQSECELQAFTRAVDFPRQEVTSNDIRIARAILAGDDPHPNQGPFQYVVGQPIPEKLRPIYADYVLRLAEMPNTLSSEIQVFRIGESAWVGLPGQTFTEIGLAIVARFPDIKPFILNLANDNLGYIATDRALLEEGGYETWAAPSNPVGAGAEAITVRAAVSLLQEAFGQRTKRAEAVERPERTG